MDTTDTTRTTDTTELKFSRGELVGLLCALNEATTTALEAERLAGDDELAGRSARANSAVFMRLASRVRRAEQALALRAADYPPGKVRPPRAWPAAPKACAA